MPVPGAPPRTLHHQFRDGQEHARGDVDDDLLRHGVVDGAREDGVAAEQPGEERVVVALFARGGGVAEEEHGGFVDEGEEAEVAGVLARGVEDEATFCAEAAGC